MKYKFDEHTEKEIVGTYLRPEKKIPIVDNVDILVVGGSQTGVTAAISAARHGMKVAIVERFGFLGGQSIYSMVVQWEKRAFINNLGAITTKGLPEEIKNRIVNMGGSDGLWNTPPGCEEMRGGEEWLNPEAIKITLMEMCEEEHIDILFHTQAVDGIVDKKEDNSLPKLRGVIFENKSGCFAINADIIIDATADLDLIWKAIGEEGCGLRDPKNRMTSAYYTWYAGIDNEKFIEWYISETENNPGRVFPKKTDKIRKHLKEKKEIKIGASAFNNIMEQAEESGLMTKIEQILEDAQLWEMVKLSMKWVGEDRWTTEFNSFNNINMLDSWELTKLEIARQKINYYMLPIIRLIPGWENAYISRESLYIGTRETRWLKAVKMIDKDHILNLKHETDPTPIDTIGRSGAHDPGKNKARAGYPIPYGILVPEKLDGVIVCGRAVGTEPGRALDAHRGIVPSMVTGQAAGTAAALSIQSEVEARNLDISKLNVTLRADGVQLDHETYSFDFELPERYQKKN